jgi:hypothetical protein
LTGVCPNLFSAVVQTNFGTGDGTLPGYAVSTADLLQTALASASRTGAPGSGDLYFYREDSGYTVDLSRLSDGAFGAMGADPSPSVLPNETALTFALDITANPDGYSLTHIRTYAGWDSGRDGQEYTVEYSTVSAPGTFVSLATVTRYDVTSFPLWEFEDHDGNPIFFDDTSNAHTLVELTHTSGVLAANVARLRFTFNGIENGGTGFREFDVIGAPTAVPEPAVAAVVAGRACWGLQPGGNAAAEGTTCQRSSCVVASTGRSR